MNRIVTEMPRIEKEKIQDKGREENLKIIFSKSLILLDTSPEELKQAQRPIQVPMFHSQHYYVFTDFI